MQKIKPIHALEDNYIWCISNPESKYCVIVDPGEAEPVLKHFKKSDLTLEAILITHHHWDHTHGLQGILEHIDARVYAPATEHVYGKTAGLSHDDILDVPHVRLEFTVLSVPGHTSGHIAFYTPGMLFCGDTLFTGGCGKIFEGTAEQMHDSLMKLAALPDDTMIYCGHEYTEDNLRFSHAVEPTNDDIKKRLEETIELRKQGLPTVPAPLSIEKRTNPFLRVNDPNVIVAAESHSSRKLKTPTEVFQVLREWKDHF